MSLRDPEESDDHLALVARVKAVQRDSDQGRNQWHNFCDTSGKGTRDPSRHPASFLRSFFEALRDGAIPRGLEALHERPLPETSDDPKEALPILIAKVKQGQRTSVEFKQRWWTYADTQHDGIRDPSKHDVASLRRFLSDIAPGGALPTSGADAPPQLAERVKQMQRQSEQIKQQWWWYCDTFGAGVRDPARHQEAFLQQFLTMTEAQAASTAGYGKAMDTSSYRYSPYDQSYAAAAAAYGCAGYSAQAYPTPSYPTQAYGSQAFAPQGYTTSPAAYGAMPAAYGMPPTGSYGAYGTAYPSGYASYPMPAASGASMQPGMQPSLPQPSMQQPGMQPGMPQPALPQPGMPQPGMQPGAQHGGMQPAMQPAMQPTVQAALPSAAPMYSAAPPALGAAMPAVSAPPPSMAGAAPGVGSYMAQTAVAPATSLPLPATALAPPSSGGAYAPPPDLAAAPPPQHR